MMMINYADLYKLLMVVLISDSLLELNLDYFAIAVIFVVTTAVFSLANCFLMILDVTGIPQSMKKYKIQEDVQVSNVGNKSAWI